MTYPWHTQIYLVGQVMCQWLQVVERSANEKSLELKDEENVQKVEKSILQERVAGSKRAQAGCAKRETCDAFSMSEIKEKSEHLAQV